MKKLLYLVSILCFICSCSTNKTEPSSENDLRSLLEDIISDTTELTIEQLDKLDIIFDSLYDRAQNPTSLKSVIDAKAIALELTNNAVARGVVDLNHLEDIVERFEKVHFEFVKKEYEDYINFNLVNVFHTRNLEDGYYDFFYLDIDLDTDTKECLGIRSYLPTCFSNSEKKPFASMLLMKGLNTDDMTSIKPISIEYDQEGSLWVAEFDEKVLDTILEYDRIIFQVYYWNDVENLETSLVNLKWFKQQYATLVGDNN